VHAGNKAADQMRSIAKCIAGNQQIQTEFETLLDSPNQLLARWAAHHLLELMSLTPRTEAKALSLIEHAATREGPDAYGEQLWLHSWYANHSRNT